MRKALTISARSWLIGVLAVGLASAAGCGSSRTYPVHGRVVFKDGSPMTDGQVVFEPVDKQKKVSARGFIQPDGSFSLGTFKDDDGAVEGEYRVLVAQPVPSPSEEGRPHKQLIHPRFESFDSSKLRYTVTRGDNNFTIVVEKP